MSQVQLPKIRRKVLGDQLEARLLLLPGAPVVTLYRGEVSAAGRRPPVAGDPGQPPLLLDALGNPDPSGRVAPYVVLFDGTGPTDLEPDLAGMNEDLRWTPQTTVVAGFSPDCAQLVDRVCAWIYRWSPSLPGVAAGRLETPPGYDAGPPRPDRQVSPPRFFVPLQWRLDLTT